MEKLREKLKSLHKPSEVTEAQTILNFLIKRKELQDFVSKPQLTVADVGELEIFQEFFQSYKFKDTVKHYPIFIKSFNTFISIFRNNSKLVINTTNLRVSITEGIKSMFNRNYNVHDNALFDCLARLHQINDLDSPYGYVETRFV
jgi:hypothetical protein